MAVCRRPGPGREASREVKGAQAVRSRARKTRSATAEADKPAPSAVPAAGAPRHGQGARAQNSGPPPDGFDGSADGGEHVSAELPAARSTSRRALKNWRVRSRLVLLIAIPTLTAIVLGGIRIGSSAQSAKAYQQVEQLATLSGKVTALAQALEIERNETIRYIVLGAAGGGRGSPAKSTGNLELRVLNQDYAATNSWASQVRSQAAGIGGSYPPLVRQDATVAVTAIEGLPALRNASTQTQLPALVVIQEYANTINHVLALDNEIALGSNDSSLADTVRVLGLISGMKAEASQQGAVLTSATPTPIGQGVFGPDKLAAIAASQANQQSDLTAFNISATPAQRQLYNDALSGTLADRATAQEQQAIALAQSSVATGGQTSSTDPTIADASAAMTYPVSALRGIETQLVGSIISRATALRNDAIVSAVGVGIAVVLVLVLALLFTTVVGRSMVRPLRKLRAGALEVAGIRLPETVRRMSETDGDDAQLDVEPIDVDSTDEIGEVARAFDQVHREALRLAANEAALRGNVNAMFVNLSRRSQSLVERQIQLIDDLELGEQDAERLANLFQMDHLATRMRRNSENLLVLAGHDVSRRWNQPVALVDVLRAAVSEIEQYERVTLNVQPGIAVRGQAVNDVVHLLSELAENATSYSSAETPVAIAGHLLSSGGVLLDITDQGVGMGAEEMAHANWRLDNPPVVDVAVSRRMGLFVVARLAARHGIRVRLRPAASGGLTALVWLPDEAVTQETEGGSPGLRRADVNVLDGVPDTAASAGYSAAGFATASPAPADSVAGVFSTGEWGSGERSVAEEAVTAARTPKFAPLRADPDDNGSGLRPRRLPGTSPKPGVATTGPLPAFRTSPQPAADAGAAPFATASPPAAAAGPSADLEQESPFGNDAGMFGAGGDVSGAGQNLFAPGTDAFSTTPAPAAPQPATTDADPFAASGDAFGTAPQPVLGTTPEQVLGAPAAGKTTDRPVQASSGLAASGWTPGSSAPGGVIVPPAASVEKENRLPIFESVESDWFRRGRHAVAGAEQEDEQAVGWDSPADEGWRAAEVVSAPSSGGVTSAGLPKRVPQANLVPGTAGLEPAAAPAPARSAAVTRDRLTSFQRGVREGRAARRDGEENQDREDDGDR
jgi:signal transduction histidine kinase